MPKKQKPVLHHKKLGKQITVRNTRQAEVWKAKGGWEDGSLPEKATTKKAAAPSGTGGE